MCDAPQAPRGDWAALVPELLVTDLARALDVWVGTCGFRIRFTRP